MDFQQVFVLHQRVPKSSDEKDLLLQRWFSIVEFTAFLTAKDGIKRIAHLCVECELRGVPECGFGVWMETLLCFFRNCTHACSTWRNLMFLKKKKKGAQPEHPNEDEAFQTNTLLFLPVNVLPTFSCY